MGMLRDNPIVPIDANSTPLPESEIHRLSASLPAWELIQVDGEARLQRPFRFLPGSRQLLRRTHHRKPEQVAQVPYVPRVDRRAAVRVPHQELVERRQRGEQLFLLDVREPHEWDIGRIDGASLIPLRTLPSAVGGLDRQRDTVVYCRTGARSARAVAYLQQLGFERVWNLAGGIHAWSDQVDPSIPKY